MPSPGLRLPGGHPRVHVLGTALNHGDAVVLGDSSYDDDNDHAVMTENMYRLTADQFMQIGMSWVKHDDWTSQVPGKCDIDDIEQDLCQVPQPPDPIEGLYPFCADAYLASENGHQEDLGPRSEINAYTGYFPPPNTRWWREPANICPPTHIDRRLQVHNDDLDPAQNAGAKYFFENHFVSADDALAGNQNNNVTYTESEVVSCDPVISCGSSSFCCGHEYSCPGCTYTFDHPSADTKYTKVFKQPAIRAWKGIDPNVNEQDIQLSNEGLLVLSAKATDVGSGFHEYEYALYNMNSHDSVNSFSVPLAANAIVCDIGFHDVDYHSGEIVPDDCSQNSNLPLDSTDWPGTVTTAPSEVRWDMIDTCPTMAPNALRWGTLYNFRFKADAPSITTSDATIGLYRTGGQVTVATETPGGTPTGQSPTDCQPNGNPDVCDIAFGSSLDCQPNDVPDECDISSGGSEDCDFNGIPDECEIVPRGACCFGNTCVMLMECECADQGGIYQGDGSNCRQHLQCQQYSAPP